MAPCQAPRLLHGPGRGQFAGRSPRRAAIDRTIELCGPRDVAPPWRPATRIESVSPPMSDQPRLALAIPADGPEPSAAGLALMAGLAARRWRVQHFRSRACPVGTEAAGRATGLPGRHLDAWLMPPEVCRTVFARGVLRADLAVVEGTLDAAPPPPAPDRARQDRPGDLGPIAEALDLPRVAVVACRGLADFHMPRLPRGVEAILLDGLERPEEFAALRRMAGLVFRVPVLGAVEALPEVRAALGRAPTDRPPPGAIEQLGASFLRFADLRLIRNLASGRPLPDPPAAPAPRSGRRFRVAYAHDEAFGGYYPDTLETLEALGADLVEFSPLRDEALPEGIDLVILGCGLPDQHIEDLAGNDCLIAALRAHVCRGHRIYAEGGGAAYLGRSLVLGGRTYPGAGILPFVAELRRDPSAPVPVTRTLARDSWLGPAGTTVRGYRSGRWRLRPAPDPGDCPARANSGALTLQRDAFVRHHAVGSLIHLHLAALPEVVAAFAGPHRASLTWPGARS